jgi:transposase
VIAQDIHWRLRRILCTEAEGYGKGAVLIKAKKQKSALFTYMFAIMDLKTRMYIAFGSNIKSEKVAFDRTMMLSHMDVDTARLDRYYSTLVYVV